MNRLCCSNIWTGCRVTELTCEGKLFMSLPPLPLLMNEAQPKFMSNALLSLQGCMIELLLFLSGILEGSICNNVGVPKI